MNIYLKKNFSLISFIFIPILHFWGPNWLQFLGAYPYWPLFWLLPWSMLHGSFKGFWVGLSLGLGLDSIGPDFGLTQIPGLAICGLWFGRISTCSNPLVGHLRYGLICSIGSLLCGSIYFSQILLKSLINNNLVFYAPGIKNILAQVFVTAVFAPLFCSLLWSLFRSSKINKSFN